MPYINFPNTVADDQTSLTTVEKLTVIILGKIPVRLLKNASDNLNVSNTNNFYFFHFKLRFLNIDTIFRELIKEYKGFYVTPNFGDCLQISHRAAEEVVRQVYDAYCEHHEKLGSRIIEVSSGRTEGVKNKYHVVTEQRFIEVATKIPRLLNQKDFYIDKIKKLDVYEVSKKHFPSLSNPFKSEVEKTKFVEVEVLPFGIVEAIADQKVEKPALTFSLPVFLPGANAEVVSYGMLGTQGYVAQADFLEQKTLFEKSTNSRKIEPHLSINDYLGVIVPYVIYNLTKYSPITLPYNRVRDLTIIEKTNLEEIQTTLAQIKKDFSAQKIGRVAKSPLFNDQFAFVERTLKSTEQQIRQMLTSKRTTDAIFSEIEKNTVKIKETVHKIAQENQALRHLAIKEQRLQRRNTHTGKQSATITIYDSVSGKLKQTVIRNAVSSAQIVNLQLEARQNLLSNNNHCARVTSLFWQAPNSLAQPKSTVLPSVAAPRLDRS